MTEVTSGILVYMAHIRAERLCADGMKEWFEHHNLDWRQLKEGIPVEEIEATGDQMALDVAKRARSQE